jgi:uncharacterized OB-fold protein
MGNGFILPDGVFTVACHPGDLDAPHWEGARNGELRIQCCRDCGRFQWGPGYICRHCHSFDLTYETLPGEGRIFSWHRSWHSTVPALKEHLPYIVLLVELDAAPGIRVLGNYAGDQRRGIVIGSPVRAVFEHHSDYSLIQWADA